MNRVNGKLKSENILLDDDYLLTYSLIYYSKQRHEVKNFDLCLGK